MIGYSFSAPTVHDQAFPAILTKSPLPSRPRHRRPERPGRQVGRTVRQQCAGGPRDIRSRGAPGREVHPGRVTVGRRFTARRFGQSAQSRRCVPTPPASPPCGTRLTPGIAANPTHRSTMPVTSPPPARCHPPDAGSAGVARDRSHRICGPGNSRVLASRLSSLDSPLPSALCGSP